MFLNFLAKIQVLQCVFLIFHVFHCFLPYSRSYNVCFSICMIFSFSLHFSYIPRDFLIFLVCQFSDHNQDHNHFSFFKFFSDSGHIPVHTFFDAHFPRFSVFLPQSRSHGVYFSYFTFFTVFHHIPGPKVYRILHVFQCFSPYFMYYHVISRFPRLTGFSPYSSSYNVRFSFSLFVFFLPYSSSYSVHFSFFTLFSVS